MKKYDLCIDARMASCSGIGTCIRQLVPFFNQDPFRVILLVQKNDPFWCKEIDQIVFDAKIYSIQEQLLFPFKIPSCDLFWSPHYNIPIFPIRAKKRIVTIHDVCHLALPDYLSKLEQFYSRFIMQQALCRSQKIATDSFFSKSEILHFLKEPKCHIHVIPMAVDRSRFYKMTKNQNLENIQNKYRLPDQFILFVGNNKSHKNLSGLLRAFSEISTLQSKLVIVGRGVGLRNYFEKIEQKNVLYLGHIIDDDLPGLYNLAQILILPSFYEGFGLPPLEAMACGCPTIVSNCSSLPEVCGDASIYVNPYAIHEIRDAIIRVMNDQALKSKLIERGYEQIKNFDWAQTAQQYRVLFENLMK